MDLSHAALQYCNTCCNDSSQPLERDHCKDDKNELIQFSLCKLLKKNDVSNHKKLVGKHLKCFI